MRQCEQCDPLSLNIVSQWSYAVLSGGVSSVVHCLSPLCLSGLRWLCVAVRAVWSIVSLLCLSGHRRLCVAVRAVWSIVSLHCVSVVLGGFVWQCEQCGSLSLFIVSQWS